MWIYEVTGRPLVLGHRGASAHAPENTLAAFRLAAEHGADGVELDAKLTADGQIVVMHDATVTRTTGAAGRVSEMSLAQIKTLDAGIYFGEQFAGERVPTLEEVLRFAAGLGRRFLIDIELTNYSTPGDGLAAKAAALVSELGMESSVIFTSFFPHNILWMRRHIPEVTAGLLAWAGRTGALSRGWPGRRIAPELVLPYHTDISDGYIAGEHQRGRKVIAWTVNSVEEIRRLSDRGVDGIITDDPQLTLQFIQS